MANTFSHCFHHLVFSTKNREKFIRQDIQARVWAYMGGIARRHGMTALQIGGMEDHAHALISAPPTIAPSQIAKSIKGDSLFRSAESFQTLVRSPGRMGMVCSRYASHILTQ